MSTTLTPAAQAVHSASIDAWQDPRSTLRGVAAAALRSLADTSAASIHDPIDGKQSVVREDVIRAIANELDPGQ